MDLGPTILDLFGISKPPYMDGVSLFDEASCGSRRSLLDAYFPAGVPSGISNAVDEEMLR